MNFIKTKYPLIIILLITLVFTKLQLNKRLSSESDICMNICSDGRGYYAWLPAIFIYHDLNCSFFEQKELKSPLCGGEVGGCIQDYRNIAYGKICNKYYPGAAFMMLPFFTMAHIYTLCFTSYEASGYSPPYFAFIGLCGIFYYFLGMYLLLKILQLLQLNKAQQSLTILLVSLGTNILYFSVDKPSYSHIYSFVLVAALLYYALLFKRTSAFKHLAYISFLLGFIFITRPVNISIALILPFMWGNNRALLLQFKNAPAKLRYLLPGCMMPMVLFTLYQIATGHFFIYSYDKEGFDFLHPHFRQFMFSYDNGLFTYMPMLLMPFLFGFLWYKKENQLFLWGTLLTLITTIYIHSSWWCWSYGFSFGARTILDFVPLFAIVIALSLQQATRKKRTILAIVYFTCAIFTMLLYNQKNHGFMNQYPITDYWSAIFNGLGMKK